MRLLTDKRPTIAVTGPDKGGSVAWLFTWYAVLRSGGRAVRVTPSRQENDFEFDGLVIGGGADVDPGLYGKVLEQTPPPPRSGILRWLFGVLFYPLLLLVRRLFSSKHYSGLDNARDKLEYRLLGIALEQDKPVLGICRGAQIINVYLQGNLHQNTGNFYTETPEMWTLRPVRVINVQPGSKLHAILETGSCQVNALHRQSIDQIGDNIDVSARDLNGIIQGVEHTSSRFLIGVQWHPEYLPHHKRQQRLFRMLVQSAREHGNDSHGRKS